MNHPGPAPAIRPLGDDRYLASPGAAGPWSDEHCHGGAPAALVTRIAGAVPTLAPMEIARAAIELLRPVPIGTLAARTTVLREGKKLQLVLVELLSEDGTEVVRANVLKLRREEQDLPPAILAQPHDLPPPETLLPALDVFPAPFGRQFALRLASGGFREPGPASLWFRCEGALFADRAATPLETAAAVGDFVNGASSSLPFAEWTFVNADLTLHFHRAPVGEWIGLAAETEVGPAGRAVARGRLADREGWFGLTTQSVLLARRAE